MRNYSIEFAQKLANIDKLSELPYRIKQIAIGIFEPVIKQKAESSILPDPIWNAFQTLKNIDDKNLKHDFAVIYEQSLVLAISEMSLVLEKYFVNYCQTNWSEVAESKKAKELKLTIGKLASFGYSAKGTIGKIILSEDNSVSFQNVQSTLRTFDEYCNKRYEVPEALKNRLIFYSECRHVIAHNGSIVSQSFMDRVKGEANIKNLNLGDRLAFTRHDWEDAKNALMEFVSIITAPPIDGTVNTKLDEIPF